jgi:formylglycine-generating enzyme required for sulfatase activity
VRLFRRTSYLLAVLLAFIWLSLTVVCSGRPRLASYALELGNGINLEMVWVQGGPFEMGSPPSEVGRDGDEGPLHPCA